MTLQKSILINNIKLWKLNQPVLSKNIEGLRGITLQDNENVTLLDETNDIVDYWAEEQIPLKKCIHVIVELLEQPVVASAWSSSVLTYEQPVTGKNKILTSGIAELQLQDKKLWVRYNDERVFLPENILGLLRVFNVDNAYEIIAEENDDVSSSSKEKGKEKEMEIKEIVCCIDEAHELLERIPNSNDETYFVRWRRQIRNIIWHGFFNVLLSTNGKIDNFLPPDTKDTPSTRMHDYFLFPAYLDVHTIDALVSLAPIGKSYVPQRTLYLGIPLWGSLAQAGVDLINILHLASQKIRNFNKKQEKDHLANLACMSCPFALQK
ncbi:unnamed protein product [Rhizophagus irregularis]|nr:unnamed protein product [Rhizophagus irregularis]